MAKVELRQCEITGQWLPEDQLELFKGKLVGPDGKRVLLEGTPAGESRNMPFTWEQAVHVARRQRQVIRLAWLFGASFLVDITCAAIPTGDRIGGLCLSVAGVFNSLVMVLFGVAVFQLVTSLRRRGSLFFSILSAVGGPIGVCLAMFFVRRAARILQDQGLRTGPFGISEKHLKKPIKRDTPAPPDDYVKE